MCVRCVPFDETCLWGRLMKREFLRKLGRAAAVATVGAGVAVLAVQPFAILSESALAAKNATLAPEQLDQINQILKR